MRSMKMAALAVAITLMCSGLALARDNDHDKDKHDRWFKHDDHDRHHDHDRDWKNDHWKDRDHDRNRERLERAIRAEILILAVVSIAILAGAIPAGAILAAAIPAADTAIRVRCMDEAAAGGTEPTAPDIRMAATWPAKIYRRTSASTRIRVTSMETARTDTTARLGTKITTRPNTATDIPLATKRTIVEEEAGRSSTWQLAISSN